MTGHTRFVLSANQICGQSPELDPVSIRHIISAKGIAMKVILAGYNLDQQIISQMRESAGDSRENTGSEVTNQSGRIESESFTPETLSAAYARISRDPRPIPELRAESVLDVASARKSNERIVFGFGHASVAEHAVFNIDVLDISRLALEALEASRLASYTEKSQRYILIDEDYLVPQELMNTPLEAEYRELIALQQAGYTKCYQLLEQYYQKKYPEKWSKKLSRRDLKGAAKEDARYFLGLATTGQVGLTMNARTLEATIQRMAAAPLAEVRELSDKLHQLCRGVAPSLVRYTDPTPYRQETSGALKTMIAQMPAPSNGAGADTHTVNIIDCSHCGEDVLLAALVHGHSRHSWAQARQLVGGLNEQERLNLARESVKRATVHESLLRQFEIPTFTFELTLSASCFAQLKRHRLATLLCQDYDPALQVTIPPSLALVDQVDELNAVCRAAELLFEKMKKQTPAAAAYALTNAHRRRVIFKANVRELCHFSRLRLDAHAQWDIRNLAEEMIAKARDRMPVAMMLAAGKDRFQTPTPEHADGERRAPLQ
jgi:flavin-dependent thymidylate synthase